MTANDEMAVPDTGEPPAETIATPVRDWLRATPGRRVAVCAVALILLQLLVRAWLSYRGFFYIDDLAFTGRAANLPTWSSDFLLTPYNNHLMPGSYLWVWATTRIWPLSFGPIVTVSLILQLIVSVLFYRLLVALFGRRPGILVPLAVFVLTPITLPAFLWWAAALNQLPQQLAMAGALLCHVRYLQTARVRLGVMGALCLAGGLLFSEKTLLMAPLIATLTILFFTAGRPLSRIRIAWRRHIRVWIAYLLIVLPYATYYAIEVPSPARKASTGADLVNLAGSSYGHALFPGLLGGPWSWKPIGFAGGLADPPGVATYGSSVCVLAVVAVSVLIRRRACFAWTLLGGYSLLNLAVLAISRATFVGAIIGDEYRYVTDLAFVAALSLSLATMQIAGRFRAGDVQLLQPRETFNSWLRQPSLGDVRAVLPSIRPGIVATVAVILYAVSSSLTSLRYDQYWRINPAKPYFTNLRQELRTAPANLILYDDYVPNEVAWALLYPYNQESLMLKPLRDRPKFLQRGQTTEHLSIIDTSGRLRVATIDGIAAKPGPNLGCGWLVGQNSRTIPLQKATWAGPWVLRLGYIASADSPVEIQAGMTTVRAEVHAGLNNLYLLAPGIVDRVRLSGLGGGATLCTDDLVVGKPVAFPGSRP